MPLEKVLQALLLLHASRHVKGYGEGLFNFEEEIQKTRKKQPGITFFSLPHCGHIQASAFPHNITARIQGLAAVAQQTKNNTTDNQQEVCVNVRVRSSKAVAWWFMVPPNPIRLDVVVRRCGSFTSTAQSFSNDGYLLKPFDMKVLLPPLPAGFSKISVQLQQSNREEVFPLAAEVNHLIWVEPTDDLDDVFDTYDIEIDSLHNKDTNNRFEFLGMSMQGPTSSSWKDMKQNLAKSYSTVRADEAQDRTEKIFKIKENASRLHGLHLHPELLLLEDDKEEAEKEDEKGKSAPEAEHSSSYYNSIKNKEKEALFQLLHPELVSALRDGSPAALWNVLRGTDHLTPCFSPPNTTQETISSTRGKTKPANQPQKPQKHQSPACQTGVYTFPVFKPKIAEKLLQEILHAKFHPKLSTLLSLPNNVGNKRTLHSGVVLDEIGLWKLAQGLAQYVVTPLSRLAYDGWGGWEMDSYHAFSIHVGDITVPGSSAKEKSEQAREQKQQWRGDKLPFHVDICESSMNICLGQGSFAGSKVYFDAFPGTRDATADEQQLHDIPGRNVTHVVGRAFLNLCQQSHGTDALTHGERHSIVVRSMSSAIRRSPAELFLEQCMGLGDEIDHVSEALGHKDFVGANPGEKLATIA